MPKTKLEFESPSFLVLTSKWLIIKTFIRLRLLLIGMALDTEKLDFDRRIPMEEVKKKLRENPGEYGSSRYTAYLAGRLGDELSPREFFSEANRIIREMSNGTSTDPTKPIPADVVVFARMQGSFLVTDLGIGLAKDYCPEDFAEAVRELHREAYLE